MTDVFENFYLRINFEKLINVSPYVNKQIVPTNQNVE